MPVGIVTVPPKLIVPDPLNVRVPVPVRVTLPPPESKVVPFAVILPPKLVAVANALPVLRSNIPVLLTVTLPVNVFVPVALLAVRVAPLETVVVPANVIATPPKVVVPELIFTLPHVVPIVMLDVFEKLVVEVEETLKVVQVVLNAPV
jgi:hypothetical protein